MKITAAAANKINELVSLEEKPGLRLRVYIVGGGCSGFQYGFAFDAKHQSDDQIFREQTAEVVIDAMSLQYLSGATLDYTNDLQGSQFVIANPNAATTCGCGASFSPT